MFLRLIEIMGLSGTVGFLLGKSDVENKRITFGISEGSLYSVSDIVIDRMLIDDAGDVSGGITDGM